MPAVLWFALFFAGAAHPEVGDAARRNPPAQAVTRLVWVDLARSGPVPAAWAQQEASRMLRQGGLHASWRTGAANQVLAPGELAVILLERRPTPGSTLVLGACTPGRGTPAVWIYVDEVKSTLGYPARVALPARETVMLARAVGRVAAHELIHMAAPALRHAATGLMAARLDRRDLLSSRLSVDGATRRGLSGLSPNSWLPQAGSMAWNAPRSVSSISVSSEAR
jgi:hypothetical protein